MAGFLNLLKPTAQLGHSSFDLSQKHVFSLSSGALKPVLCVETVPDDRFHIDLASLMRTLTFNTASFLRGKLTFDFFFVPYSQLWHPFNQFIGQRKDVHSSNQLGINFVPCISLGRILEYIEFLYHEYHNGNVEEFNGTTDVHGIPLYITLIDLLDMLGYGNFKPALEYLNEGNDVAFEQFAACYQNQYVNVFRFAAYQHIWYDYYRNKYYDTEVHGPFAQTMDYVRAFNFDNVGCRTFSDSLINHTTFDRNNSPTLQMAILFQQRYVQWKQDLFQSALPSTQFGAVSTVDLTFDASVGVNGTATLSGTTGTDVGRWTAGDGLIASSSQILSRTTGDSLRTTDVNPNGNYSIQHNHLVTGTAQLSTTGYLNNATGSFDVLALRRAEALQKWRQNALRAGNMVDDTFEAHYGVKPRFESDENVLKIGSFESVLNVNAVETTAISSQQGNNKVGDLGATGVSVTNGKQIDFHSKDFGVIMCCAYFRPETEYNSTMIDRANTLTEPFDFYTPEFQNQGLDSIRRSDYNIMQFSVTRQFTPQIAQQQLNDVLGFANQYWWYKCAFDKVHGDFSRIDYYNWSNVNDSTYSGSLLPWVSPRNIEMLFDDGTNVRYRTLESLYIKPSILDDVFAVDYITDPRSGVNDTFLCNTYFDIKAVRPMTVLGLPQF